MKFPLPADTERRSVIDRLFRFFYNLKSGDRLLMAVAAFAFFVCSIWLTIALSAHYSVAVPAAGGELTEGILGTPRFVNPVLAVTRADRDMSALIYSGLMKLGADGAIEPDMAQSLTISEDGLVYNIILRDDITFHDGTPLTADDVAYTIAQIQNPSIGSPLRASWEGVSVEVIGEHELNFVLPTVYTPFVENLTVGILPRHIWQNASPEEFPFSQYNSEPIGSGAYRIERVYRDQSGIPSSYVLTPYKKYYGTEPKIKELTLTFYANEPDLVDAFNEGLIDSVAGLSTESLSSLHGIGDTHTLITGTLPRTFAVFFNQNKSTVLRDSAAREALDAAIDRDELIETILGGYGVPLSSPIPPGFDVETVPYEPGDDPLETARETLRQGGWTVNSTTGILEKEIDGQTVPLSISIATANTPVFTATANFIEQKWRALGVQVSVKQFEQSDLTQVVIRPRNYEALLFGTALGRPLDFYSFWHSSQRSDPGLNVALYANITTDTLLSTARTAQDEAVRTEAIEGFVDALAEEVPAVFLYSPVYTYVLPENIVGTKFTQMSELHERFANIQDWYIEKNAVWPLFQ